MVQVARKRHKTMPKSVVIRCSHVDCRRRVRRKPHAGSRYCSARCRTAAYRDRRLEQVLVVAIALRLEALKGDAARERVRTRAIRESVIQEVRDLLFTGRCGRGAYTLEEKARMREFYRREREAIRAAVHLSDLPRIRKQYDSLREPIIQEALKRPYKAPKMSAESLARSATSGKRKSPRRKKPKLKLSPLQLQEDTTTGRGGSPAIVVRR